MAKKLSKAAQSRIASYEAKSTLVTDRKETKRKDNFMALAISGGAIVLAIAAQLVYFNFGPGVPKPTPKTPTVPAASVSENRVWTGSMRLQDKSLPIELYGDKAPQAVANFVTLAKKSFYNGLKCHRLTTSGIFVLQCGDPNGDGSGGPGYSFGPIENAPADNVYGPGIIAMARTTDNAKSMGSQFFIVYGSSFIPADKAGGYTVIGKVTKNLDYVRELAKLGTADGKTDGAPKNPIQIKSVLVK